ncbi:hypothetical protein ACA910_017687 [Epithemia clementina (nom. ined.)]
MTVWCRCGRRPKQPSSSGRDYAIQFERKIISHSPFFFCVLFINFFLTPPSGVLIVNAFHTDDKEAKKPKKPFDVDSSVAVNKEQPPQISAGRVEKFITLASQYLVRVCHDALQDDPEHVGRFTYLAHMDEELEIDFVKHPQDEYNLLRHNGAIYALGQTFARNGHIKYNHNYDIVHLEDANISILSAMKRATKYLKEQSIGPVPVGVSNDSPSAHDDLNSYTKHVPNVLAAWETKAISPGTATPIAKLGGSGLALIALVSLERVLLSSSAHEEEESGLDYLRQMGGFIAYLQHSDGSFTSRYKPARGGKDDSWTSLYYPGEACLGLAYLAMMEKDPVQKHRWITIAKNTLLYLEKLRRTQNLIKIQPDHWALLATAEILPLLLSEPQQHQAADKRGLFSFWNSHQANADDDHSQVVNDEYERIYQHGIKVVRSIVRKARPNLLSQRHGCLTSDRETCSTSTRLEGLIASLRFIRPDEPAQERRNRRGGDDDENGDGKEELLLKDQVEQVVHYGISFLLDSQQIDTTNGMQGAIPKKYPHVAVDDNIVRVDYVQHALSAMIAFEKWFFLGGQEDVEEQQHLGSRSSQQSSEGHVHTMGILSLLLYVFLLIALLGLLLVWLFPTKKRKTRTH